MKKKRREKKEKLLRNRVEIKMFGWGKQKENSENQNKMKVCKKIK